MTKDEYNAWKRTAMYDADKWVVDPVHNGVYNDLLITRSHPEDVTKGIYVNFVPDGKDVRLKSGSYEGAIPHVGEAEFYAKRNLLFRDDRTMFVYAIDRLKMTFLEKIPYIEHALNRPYKIKWA